MQRSLFERIEDWWYFKFVEDAGVYEELDYKRIRSWKLGWCKLVGHVELDVVVGEDDNGLYITDTYALVCKRCGSWLS